MQCIFARSDLVCPSLSVSPADSRSPQPLEFCETTLLQTVPGFAKLWPNKLSAKTLPFACISAAASSSRGSVEPSTGLSFPEEYCTRGVRDCPKLTGMGPRIKRVAGVGVKVYAVGMYVDEKGFKSAMGKKYGGMAPAKLCDNASFFDDIMQATHVEKTIRLVFAREVKGPTIRDALSKALQPKLKNSAELASFENYFDGLSLKKGSHLSFSTSQGVLTTFVGDKKLGVITSQPLCAALFDCYLGQDPVSKTAKDNITKELAMMLK